jgi:hypothetical protein
MEDYPLFLSPQNKVSGMQSNHNENTTMVQQQNLNQYGSLKLDFIHFFCNAIAIAETSMER